eukprot:COSAG06_NODE_5_length_38423_cov_121.612645_19_plen_79_part_00
MSIITLKPEAAAASSTDRTILGERKSGSKSEPSPYIIPILITGVSPGWLTPLSRLCVQTIPDFSLQSRAVWKRVLTEP